MDLDVEEDKYDDAEELDVFFDEHVVLVFCINVTIATTTTRLFIEFFIE